MHNFDRPSHAISNVTYPRQACLAMHDMYLRYGKGAAMVECHKADGKSTRVHVLGRAARGGGHGKDKEQWPNISMRLQFVIYGWVYYTLHATAVGRFR